MPGLLWDIVESYNCVYMYIHLRSSASYIGKDGMSFVVYLQPIKNICIDMTILQTHDYGTGPPHPGCLAAGSQTTGSW